MGICKLELRKQDVVGEQWSRAVYEDIVMLAELDPKCSSLLDPGPRPLKQQGQPPSQAQSPQIISLLPMPYSPPPPIKPVSIKV